MKLLTSRQHEEDDFEMPEETAPENFTNKKENTGKEPAFKEFAESEFPDQQTIDKFIDSFSDDELQAQADTILKPVIKMIQEANSYEEIYEKLSEKGLRTNEIEKILQKVIFVSETWGQINGLD